jgi:hypothetical protein
VLFSVHLPSRDPSGFAFRRAWCRCLSCVEASPIASAPSLLRLSVASHAALLAARGRCSRPTLWSGKARRRAGDRHAHPGLEAQPAHHPSPIRLFLLATRRSANESVTSRVGDGVPVGGRCQWRGSGACAWPRSDTCSTSGAYVFANLECSGFASTSHLRRNGSGEPWKWRCIGLRRFLPGGVEKSGYLNDLFIYYYNYFRESSIAPNGCPLFLAVCFMDHSFLWLSHQSVASRALQFQCCVRFANP